MTAADLRKFLRSPKLKPNTTFTHQISNDKRVVWTEFGEHDIKKAKHTVLYMHGTPMCRLEPMIHSIKTEDIYKLHSVRLCCFERPGFGQSPIQYGRQVKDYILDIEEVLNTHPSFQSNTSNNTYAMGFSAGGPYALGIRYLLPHRVKSVAVIASSVSAAFDIQYKNSNRGLLESLFFSLPIFLQTLLYRLGVNAFLIQLNIIIHMIKMKLIDRYLFYDLYQTTSVPSSLSSSLFSSLILQPSPNIDIQNASIHTTIDQERQIVIEKLYAIQYILYESTHLNGYEGINIDTLMNQSDSIPWGFDIPPYLHQQQQQYMSPTSSSSSSSSSYSNMNVPTNMSDFNKMNTTTTTTTTTTTATRLYATHSSSPLPPILFYYSKEDMTVPYTAGIHLSKHITGKEPIWLSGGHNCFILHLNRILSDLLYQSHI